MLLKEEPCLAAYFTEHYCTEDRLTQWAAWARVGCDVNTNMYVERFNRTLKYKFLKRTLNNRVDDLIHKLLLVAKNFHATYVIDRKRLSASSFRLHRIHNRHRLSNTLSQSQVIFHICT